jgi:ubiquinone/menaquinone biosynthesis C-methylase UbiE
MTSYLNYQFKDTPEFVNTFDELPLWSASFGLLLLKHLQLKPNMKVLDIGSGAGFPLLELAQRLGKSCKCYGLDPWVNANERAKRKIHNYGVSNAEIIEGSAAAIPFKDGEIDLIVSNLGVNNFDDPQKVFKECNRVLKRGGRLALTTNLDGHWVEFYKVFEEVLIDRMEMDIVRQLREQQEHRGTVATISRLFKETGFKVTRTFEDKFEMKFADGTAFLNHYFVKLGWLTSWIDLVPEPKRVDIFTVLEENLNKLAAARGELLLTVPMAYIEAEKI